MSNPILSLAKQLIAIPSMANNPAALAQVLDLAVSQMAGFTIESFEHKGVRSVLVYVAPKRPKRFTVILNGHLDVIAGKPQQYRPTIRANRLYGVGALDMKANASCLIQVFKDVAKIVRYPLALQLVTDEEVGGLKGTKYQIEEGVKADFIIAGETTNLDIVSRAKGILWVKISATGAAAHGAYPWRGVNAIGRMNTFLTVLESRYPTPEKELWETTVNVSRIATSNQALNKIPDDCSLWLDIRYVPEDAPTIVRDLKTMLPKGFQLEVLVKEPAMAVNPQNRYVQLLQSVGKQVTQRKPKLYGANGSSDARHFTAVGCAGVEFGAIGGGIGSDNEWIDIESLKTYYQILKEFLLAV